MTRLVAMRLGVSFGRSCESRCRSEQAAFEALLEPCWERLWRYAYRMTGDRDGAEDLLSESFLEAYRSFGQFRGDTDFARWMYRIMTTTRIDMVRKANRRKADSLDAKMSAEGDDKCWDVPDSTTDPEEVVVGPMVSEEVQRALDALPEEFRSVVILADMEQMDYADISAVLHIPVGTVRSRLHRARTMLRKQLVPPPHGGK